MKKEELIKEGYTQTTVKGNRVYMSDKYDYFYSFETKQLYLYNEVDGNVWNLRRVLTIDKLKEITNLLSAND